MKKTILPSIAGFIAFGALGLFAGLNLDKDTADLETSRARPAPTTTQPAFTSGKPLWYRTEGSDFVWVACYSRGTMFGSETTLSVRSIGPYNRTWIADRAELRPRAPAMLGADRPTTRPAPLEVGHNGEPWPEISPKQHTVINCIGVAHITDYRVVVTGGVVAQCCEWMPFNPCGVSVDAWLADECGTLIRCYDCWTVYTGKRPWLDMCNDALGLGGTPTTQPTRGMTRVTKQPTADDNLIEIAYEEGVDCLISITAMLPDGPRHRKRQGAVVKRENDRNHSPRRSPPHRYLHQFGSVRY